MVQISYGGLLMNWNNRSVFTRGGILFGPWTLSRQQKGILEWETWYQRQNRGNKALKEDKEQFIEVSAWSLTERKQSSFEPYFHVLKAWLVEAKYYSK